MVSERFCWHSEIDMLTSQVWPGNLSSIPANVQCLSGWRFWVVLLPEFQKQQFLLWPGEGLSYMDHFLMLESEWVALGTCFMFTGIWKAILEIPRGNLSWDMISFNFLFCGLKSSSLQMTFSQVNRSHFKGQPQQSGRGCLRAGRMPNLPWAQRRKSPEIVTNVHPHGWWAWA